jgi:hypothetical protein
MKTLPLVLLVVLVSAAPVPAQNKSGSLDLEYKPRPPALRPVPRQKIEEDTTQAVREIDRQRTERILRESQPAPPRRPDLDRDVTQGIQSRGLAR